MRRAMDRRQLLEGTLLGTLSAAAAANGLVRESRGAEPASAGQKTEDPAGEPIPIVDTHQHLWDLDQFHLPWLRGSEGQPIHRSFLMRDYFEAARGLNVVKTVYMEVDVDPAERVQEAEFVIDLCRRADNPMVAAVVGGAPQSASFRAIAERFADSPYVKGFRTVLHNSNCPPGTCLEPRFIDNMKRLGELGLRFDLCLRPGEIADGVRLAAQCPQTQFILDHCGNMSVESTDRKLRETWLQGIREMAQLDNTVCKISGIVATASQDWRPADLAPNVDFCLDAFGPDRVCFAGDWPVCTLRATLKQWVDALKWIVRDRPAPLAGKLFHDNAIRIYGLG